MIDFDVAKTWHEIFAQKIGLIVSGIVTDLPSPDEIGDESACKLGHWLNSAQADLKKFAAYHELTKAHAAFHHNAADVLRIVRGECPNLSITVAQSNFSRLSGDVTHLLDQLAAECAADVSHQYHSRYSPPSTTSCWDDSLYIGLPAIDQHHKAIADILDKLKANQEVTMDSDFGTAQLGELGKILAVHFTIEEAYMKQFGMPDEELNRHSKRHNEILDELVDFNMKAMAQPSMKMAGIIPTVSQWVIDHVVEYDFEIKKYLPA